MELVVIALIVGLVLYGLERNKNRKLTHPHLAGSTDVQDRDRERVSAELFSHI